MSEKSGPTLNDAVIRTAIRESELFAGLDDAARQRLLDSATTVTIPTGDALIREGEEGDSFYMIQEGAVRVYVNTGDKAEYVRTLGPGAVLGEISLLCGRDRTATCIADGGALKALRFDHKIVDGLMNEMPELRERLNSIAVPRAQETMRRLYS